MTEEGREGMFISYPMVGQTPHSKQNGLDFYPTIFRTRVKWGKQLSDWEERVCSYHIRRPDRHRTQQNGLDFLSRHLQQASQMG
jgi:hypothetical protein